MNGFDERLGYGGLDREFGERLERCGMHGIQARYSLICLHLDHPRPYREREIMAANWRSAATTRGATCGARRTACRRSDVERESAPALIARRHRALRSLSRPRARLSAPAAHSRSTRRATRSASSSRAPRAALYLWRAPLARRRHASARCGCAVICATTPASANSCSRPGASIRSELERAWPTSLPRRRRHSSTSARMSASTR